MNVTTTPLVASIASGLRVMWGDEGAHEVRLKMPNDILLVGVFDSPQLAAEAIAKHDATMLACWTTLNPVTLPVTDRLARSATAAKDTDVLRRERLVVDFDPIRFDEAGVPLTDPKAPSTDAELGRAIDRAMLVSDTLEGMGWPPGGWMQSGNGCWLVYAVDLPAEGDLIGRVLQALAEKFDNKQVKIDVVLGNAGRVGKVPCTMTRKGVESPGRSWRRAGDLIVRNPVAGQPGHFTPGAIQVVPSTLLEALVKKTPSQPSGLQMVYEGAEIDSDKWLTDFLVKHGVALTGETADLDAGGYLRRLARCPFVKDHDPSYKPSVGVGSGGGFIFKCMGNRCAGRGWDDFRALYETKYEQLVIGSGKGKAPTDETRDQIVPGLFPVEFWEAEEKFRIIRDAALSRGRPAEASFVTCVMRVIAASMHHILVPDTGVGGRCTLTLGEILYGPPGTAKTDTVKGAIDLIGDGHLKAPADMKVPGSGQGLAALLVEKVKQGEGKDATYAYKQMRYNGFLYCDEMELVANQAQQSSNTFLPTFRGAFSSVPLGNANADPANRREVPGLTYVFGFVFNAHPGLLAVMFGGAAAGTPQRVVFVNVGTPVPDPDHRPDPPGGLGWAPLIPEELVNGGADPIRVRGEAYYHLGIEPEIASEVQWADWRKRQNGCDALDEHAMLVRLKVASGIALLLRRAYIDATIWRYADVVMTASNEVRAVAYEAEVRAAQEKAATGNRAAATKAKVVNAAVEDDTARRRAAIVRVAGWITGRVCKAAERWHTRKQLNESISKADREFLDAGIDQAEGVEDIVTEWVDTPTGSPSRRCRCNRR